MAVRSLPLTPVRLTPWDAARRLLHVPEQRLAILLLLPILLVVVATMLYPLAVTIQLALTSETGEFVGLDNLARLPQTTAFLDSVSFTLRFAAFVVVIALLVGLGLALLVNSARVPAKTLWITVLIIPLMVSDIVSAVVWRLMYHPTIGVINYVLSFFSVPPVAWLGQPTSAFFAVAVIEIWRSTPFFFLMLYAALQLIPRYVYESAAVDGAGRIRSFFDMTLPYLRPVMTVAAHAPVHRRLESLRFGRDRHRGRPGARHLEHLLLHSSLRLPLAAAALRQRGGTLSGGDDDRRRRAHLSLRVGAT